VQLTFVLLANTVNSALLMQLYPYIGLFIQSFQLADRSDTGYYTGYLSAAFMVGRTLSSGLWGWTTDHWGRKPALVHSLWFLGLASLGLGLSGSFGMALIFRFLSGFLNSLFVTTNTLASEVCPESYQAQAMSLQALTRQVGLIAGTVIGILPDPMFAQYFQGTVLETYPFLLPNALIALLCFVTALGSQVYLSETLDLSAKSDLSTPLLAESETSSEQNTFKALLADNTVRLVTLIFSLTAGVHAAMMDLIPVWSWAKKSDGGLELNIQTIGYTIATANIATTVIQQVLFVRLKEAKGYLWIFYCNSICFIPLSLLLPLSHYLLDSPVLFWAYFLTTFSFWCLFCQQIFTVEYLLINNSVMRKQRGKVNGLSMTFSSLFRSAASPIFTILFAVTATGGLAYPLDFTCAFSLTGLVAGIGFLLSLRLPKSIERSKDYQVNTVDKLK